MRRSHTIPKPAKPKFTYELLPGVLKTFADPGIPFLTFAHFVDIVQWYRDVYFAPEHVPGFEQDIGKKYQVWTRSATSLYERHLFPGELGGPVTISFEIPSLPSAAWFPLFVSMYDDQGLYFRHEQKLVIERNIGDRMVLSSWQKVPTVRNFLVMNAQ
ncbi:MAG: hypothetical protein QNJ44_19760 [Rhodobacter sp.]|nr:hypothetical protein [Rhodobacter sp.]